MSARTHRPVLSRRRLLGGLAGAAALAPFLPVSEARAATGPIKRLILLFSACGTIAPNWEPTGTKKDFKLGPILAPLAPHQADLIVLKGLRILPGGPGSNHMQGAGKIWTGSALLPGNEFSGGGGASSGWGGGPSIDQLILDRTAPGTPFGSLELGVRTGAADVRSRQCYRAANEPLPAEDNPYKVFARLFGDFGADKAALEKLFKRRQSVLDHVKAELDAMAPRHGAADRHKLEQHLEHIRAIEKRLTQDHDYAAACVAPKLAPDVAWSAMNAFPKVSRMQIDLMVMALTCDMTRIASLAWNHATSGQKFSWLGIDETHHDLSHRGDGDVDAQTKLTQINAWHAGEVAYLIDRLKSIPEGDGTLFDSTLIVWGNELGKGNNHSLKDIPFVLAGSAGGSLVTGRFHKFTERAHNRLLVEIGRAFGVADLDSFGDLDEGTGGLDVLHTG